MSEKHLRITTEEVVALPELTYAELKLYLYLRTLDPFGDRKLEIETAVLSEQLGFSRRTIQRSLHTLNESDLIDWQVIKSKITTKTATSLSPSDKVVAKRQNRRLSDKVVAEASGMSPKRQECREQSLEVNQGNDSRTLHTSSSSFNLSHSDRSDEFSFFLNANTENSDEAIATLQANLDHGENCDLNHDKQADDIKTPVKVINPIEGDSTRRQLEDFILNSLQVSPRDRTAYFSRFTAADWEKWEAKFKPPVSPPAPPLFVPEVVEVAPPEIALENIAKIREMLKRGGSCN
jgi:hypothetical protein